VASGPPLILPSRASQDLIVGVIETPPSCQRLIRPWPFGYFDDNYPPQMVDFLSDRYRMAAIYAGAGDEAVTQFRSWRPDVIINNVTNAEYLRTRENLAEVHSFAEALRPPIINPPVAAARCTRQMNVETLRDIDGLILPNVRRFRRDMSRLGALMDMIEAGISYPMIVSTPSEQEARNVTLAHDRAGLEEAIRRLESPQFYIIAYLGQPRMHQCFRRMRAAFIGGQPIVIRADYARDRIVRSRFVISLGVYHDHPDLVQKADAIIRAPRAELGEKPMATLEAIGQAIPLDIFGLDFDVDDDGNVVFFEANATMGLMTPAPDPFPYPPEATQRLTHALDQLLHRVAASLS